MALIRFILGWLSLNAEGTTPESFLQPNKKEIFKFAQLVSQLSAYETPCNASNIVPQHLVGSLYYIGNFCDTWTSFFYVNLVMR
jgi:hypothetical protein